MTHPAYLLARLNPKNVRFDVGSGGVPDLTSQDIAAALGMVPAGLGRELICLAWWPSGAMLTAPKLAELLEQMQRAEWMRREESMLDALLAVASHTGGDSLRRAQRMYAAAHAARWPKWVADPEVGQMTSGYAKVRSTVLRELVSPGLCSSCGGRGDAVVDGRFVKCSSCRGVGRRSVSDTWRAEQIGITEAGFRRVWKPVYEWTHCLCTESMRGAGDALSRSVGD